MHRVLNSIFKTTGIPGNSNRPKIVSIILKSNYADKANVVPANGNTSPKFNLSIGNLGTIPEQINNNPLNGKQALEILYFCRNSASDKLHRETVQTIWTKIKEKKISLSDEHYTTVIQFYKNIGDTNGALNIFQELNKKRPKPSAIVYQTILQMYCEQNDVENVTNWLERISEAGYFLNEKTFNTLAQCYAKNGNIELANYAISKLKENKFKINHHTLRELSKCYARDGDIENLKKSLDSYKAEKIELHSIQVLKCIELLYANGHEHCIKEIGSYIKLDDVPLSFSKISIEKFVENGKSPVVPMVLPFISKNVEKGARTLVESMRRANVPDELFNKTIANLKTIGVNLNADSMKEYKKSESESSNHHIPKATIVNAYNTLETEDSRFYTFVRERNISEVEALLAKGGMIMNHSRNALLIELYTDVKNLDKALNTLKQVRLNSQSFVLDFEKVAKLVTLMVESNYNSDEIVELISTHRQEKPKHRIFLYERLFDTLVAAGNDELLNKLYRPLVDNNHVEETEKSTSFLIAVHVIKGDLKRAVDVYDEIVETKNLMPFTFKLFCELIEKREVSLLERVYSKYEKIRGEALAHYRLAFACIQCGYHEKANIIFKKNKIVDISKKITHECRLYEQMGKIEEAKELLKATKGVYCNRHVIYRAILEIYCKNKQVQEVLKLWQEHANDTLKPRQGFMERIANFLSKNNTPIPDDLSLKLQDDRIREQKSQKLKSVQ